MWTGIPFGGGAVASVGCTRAMVPSAGAAITIEPGGDKVTTQRVALDFGDAGGNVERSTMRVRVTATNAAGPSLPADSAPTIPVVPLQIRAALWPGLAQSCTGLPVVLDGSGSKTPDGSIVRYKFEYQPLPLVQGIILSGSQEFIANWLKKVPKTTLYDGTNPAPSATFNWNRTMTDENEAALLHSKLGDYVRDLAVIALTVTDKAGRSATRLQEVWFAQWVASRSRVGCPGGS